MQLKPIKDEPIYNAFSNSKLFDDRLISPHPRFSGLTYNCILRRGSNTKIKIPIYKDVNTS
jgi:hypothetical protein